MIYLATPYTDKDPKVMTKRFTDAAEAASILANHGVMVYSPICHWHPIAIIFDLPRGIAFWEKLDEHMISLSSLLVILRLAGYETSSGIRRETEIAKRMDKPIISLKHSDLGNLKILELLRVLSLFA